MARKAKRKQQARRRHTQNARRAVASQRKRKNSRDLERFYMFWRRISVIALACVCVLWGAAWFVLSDGPARFSEWTHKQAIFVSAQLGFRVQKITVDGITYTNPDVLLALLNMHEGDPLFLLDPVQAKEQIEKIGWVKSAHVERRLPGTVYIRLEERTPSALWYHAETLALVDKDGTVITDQGLERFRNLLMVRGAQAPERVAALTGILDRYAPSLKEKLDHASLVDGRRWDLFLRDDKRIKLPEDHPGDALEHIMVRDRQAGILSRDVITDIDARYQGRLIVRTRLGTVQDYKAGLHPAGVRL